ncbi:hypothetical protein O8I42_01610 [Campylobacter lari]|uniref:hypothetical protein n=1 Tax=Campylobacter lari TaxID=201 RepID=UPI0012771F4B|nr:hypothetical protein [Campylobacter lari]EAI4827813.1 hypothetical protein [Campylobacter lari]EAK0440205.1 hypothetical protein [Campylobacter lari]EAK0793949.1 hypothetical protein [Campylobacter lari]EAK0794625.1 hypothetical protein [Campylobacter lari]
MGYYPNIASEHIVTYDCELTIPQYDYHEFLNALDDLNIDYYQTEFNQERVELSVEEIDGLSLDNFEGDLLILAKTLKAASNFEYARKSGFVIVDFF